MARSRRSISSKRKDEADETYVFPYLHNNATFATKNSMVIVEYKDDGNVLIIAGKIPGMIRYYENYPFNGDEQKIREHEFSRELLDEALDFLSEYDPQTSSSKTNQGNKDMRDIYVEVSAEKRDEVVMKMWNVLNYLKDRHIEFLKEWKPEDYQEHPSLEDEIISISKQSEMGDVA